MPNYVMNRVVMTGEQSQIDELVRAVQFSDEAFGSVDFSKVIPMPPGFDIPEGCHEPAPRGSHNRML